jgi:hypothetical protein
VASTAFALQQMLGHASLKTSEIYLRWADQRQAMERARRVLTAPLATPVITTVPHGGLRPLEITETSKQ